MTREFRHARYLWDDAHASTLTGVDRLVYRSNLLGADQRITNTGGGNTSSKLTETDPLTGEPVEVLWVKGSGGDLRTSTRVNFASLYQEKVLSLRRLYDAADERGPKTAIEDDMVGCYPHCTFACNPRASSIDTPLHAFVPAKHIDHLHPNAVIAIAAAARSEELTREIYGDEIIWTPWQRPGFDLGLVLEDVVKRHPQAKGVILGQHGLINWADDDRECYELSLSLIERAGDYLEKHDRGAETFGGERYAPLGEPARREVLTQLLPWLRGAISREQRFVATIESDETVLRFVDSHDAPRLAELGTSCPDHFLRTKIKPLYVDWDPHGEDLDRLRQKLESGLEQYREDYRAYYEACRHDDSPAMRDPNPTVILIPGVGLVAWGKSKSESRVTAEFYRCAIEVMRGAEAIDEYVALPAQEAFDIEYWLLEEAKLQRMPAEKELARRIAVVVGAGSGIGREIAQRLVAEGAHVVCADRDREATEETARIITDTHGVGIGVAGTGTSGCGPTLPVECDLTDRESIRSLFRETLWAYGGVDHVVVTAGIFAHADETGRVPDARWNDSFAVNVTGSYLVADEARSIWEAQELPGSLVLTTSVNAVVPKVGSLAYDTSKAAANHLVRELAVGLAPHVRVNGVAPATVLEGSSMFPRDRVLASLRKYDLPASDDEPTETLRDRLAAFYARRNLTGRAITPGDVAEAIFLLVSDRFGQSTGQILAVDGGLPEAFLR